MFGAALPLPSLVSDSDLITPSPMIPIPEPEPDNTGPPVGAIVGGVVGGVVILVAIILARIFRKRKPIHTSDPLAQEELDAGSEFVAVSGLLGGLETSDVTKRERPAEMSVIPEGQELASGSGNGGSPVKQERSGAKI